MLNYSAMQFFIRIIYILAFAYLPGTGYAQNIKADSLKKVLAKEATDSVTVKKYISFAENKLQANNTAARIAIMEWVEAIAIKNKDHLLQAKVYFWKGSYYMKAGDNQQAVISFTKCLDFSHNMDLKVMENKATLAIGTFYYVNEQYEKAIPIFEKGVEASKRLNNLTDLTSSYISLANAIFDATEKTANPRFDEVIQYRKLAAEIAEKTKDTARLIKIFTNIGTTYNLKKNYAEADNYFAKAASLLAYPNYDNLRYFFYANTAEVERLRGKHKEAIESYVKVLETFEKSPNPFVEYQVQHNLASLYAATADYEKAYKHQQQYILLHDSVQNVEKFKASAELENKYQQAIKDNEINRLTTAEKIKLLEIEKQKAIIAGNLAEAQKKENEIALLFQQKEIQELQIQQQNEELEKKTLQAKAIGQEIQLAKKEKELTENQIKVQRTTRNYLISGLALLGLLAFGLIRNIVARKKAYVQLQDKSEQIKEQALELGKQAKQIAQFQSQMNPHFVYNALHNIQGLVLNEEPEKANAQIVSLAQLMRKTFANAEKDDISIEEEINYLNKYIEFENNAFENNLAFEVVAEGEARTALIPPMMIQPFVENAIKHAELKRITNPYIKVLIAVENNLLSINIKDNGKGIEQKETDKLSHSISVIKSRLNLLFKGRDDIQQKAVFTIKSIPEISEGTMVQFYLPLNYAY